MSGKQIYLSALLFSKMASVFFLIHLLSSHHSSSPLALMLFFAVDTGYRGSRYVSVSIFLSSRHVLSMFVQCIFVEDENGSRVRLTFLFSVYLLPGFHFLRWNFVPQLCFGEGRLRSRTSWNGVATQITENALLCQPLQTETVENEAFSGKEKPTENVAHKHACRAYLHSYSQCLGIHTVFNPFWIVCPTMWSSSLT